MAPRDRAATGGTQGDERVASLVSRKDGKQEAPSFTLAEVAKHSTAEDCWLIIHGKVYDVTKWVPKHPGGPIIYVAAGKDCSQLFDSYHQLYVSGMLSKYYIGEVKLQPGEEGAITRFEEDMVEGKFYYTAKKRVEQYFKDNKLDPRTHPEMFIKSAVILTTLFTAYYYCFYGFTSFLACLFCAVVVGAMKAEIGVSIMHDANHGSYSRSTLFGRVMGATLDIAGASSFMWRQQHVVGHHAFTNIDGLDPDIRVSDKDVRRVTFNQPWHPYMVYQHVYLAVLYGALAIKSIYVDDFKALAEGSIGSVKLTKLNAGEKAVFWGGKAAYALYMLVLPLLFSGHSVPRLLALWLATDAVTGWMLAYMFQVAHVVDDVAYPKRDPKTGKVPMGWGQLQVATTADFCHGSKFWLHVSGGLNYQVVHHLFPGVCHCHYPALAEIVKRTAKEFGVPYKVYPTFMEALKAHFRQLRVVGLSAVPSLSTIG